MAKRSRPSIISGLELPPAEEAVAEVEAKPRPDVVHTSIYVPRQAHRRLREIALTRDVKVHDLIMEGVDDVLRKHGHPSLSELRSTKTP